MDSPFDSSCILNVWDAGFNVDRQVAGPLPFAKVSTSTKQNSPPGMGVPPSMVGRWMDHLELEICK
jgi:hypothetical protein